jgi:hypothetical protein
MRYWLHGHNVRHEIGRRADNALLKIAYRMPRRLRMWAVVVATNEARKLYPHPSGYAGPDGLTYAEIHDGALGERRPA